MSGHALQQVIVIPRNGYINRLQAWASASILGDALGVVTRLLWEPDAVAPTAAEELFEPAFLEALSISRAEVDLLLACDHEVLPRYLSTLPARRALVLAGHDRGEQVFMPQLFELIAGDASLTSLVIIAGGQFHAPTAHDFDRSRRVFYQSLHWNLALDSRVQAELKGRDPFLAAHIRQTDRSLTAPTTTTVRDALAKLHKQTQLRSLFVAADTANARDQWHDIARGLGLDPWSVQDQSQDRSSGSGGVSAMVDWRLLGAAQGLVYSKESSFGHEAATVIGSSQQTIGLTATNGVQRARAMKQLVNSALTYPRRHFRTQ